MKGRCAIHVHNAGTVSQQRLGKRVTRLGPQRMSEVCSALRFSLRCEAQ
jgi:mRNA-degrading endonuclease toxin of MazEF toxin-antitoxin module